jgi:myo-inositol-1-phosphate synthase
LARTGVWLVGARGGVSTTVIAGLAAMKRQLTQRIGLLTETSLFEQCDLPSIDDLIIGGHEIRDGSIRSSAEAICTDSGSISHDIIEQISDDLEQVEKHIRPGVLLNAGEAILSLQGIDRSCIADHPTPALERIESDLRQFIEDQQLDGIVVVNLASTEAAHTPPPMPSDCSRDAATTRCWIS